MEKVSVRIKGIAPLLSNKFDIAEDDGKAGRKDKQYIPKEEADKLMYFDDEIGCYAPSTWIEASIREASKGFKQGRGTFKNTILASVFIDKEKIPLKKKTYDEIDRRFARIQRNGIVKCRPRFNSWELEFDINYESGRISKENLELILREAGATKGIGDYRPKFGRFEVVFFE